MRIATRCAIFTVLFAQAAIAANACLQPRSVPAFEAVTQASTHCDTEKRANLNLCFYQHADQSDQHPQQHVIAASAAPILTVAESTVGARDGARLSILPGAATHDPPIPIRFCSFLI